MADFYTSELNEFTFIDSVTDSKPGTDKNRMFDNNLDTHWEPTNTTGTKSIIIDTQSTSHTLNCIALWLRNGSDYAGPSADVITIYDSTDKATWGAENVLAYIGDFGSSYLKMIEFDSSDKRYFKIDLSALTVAPQIAGIWLCEKHILSRGSEYPINDGPVFYNDAMDMSGGRMTVRPRARNSVDMFKRSYKLLSSAENTTIEDMFNACRGRRFPLIVNEGTVILDSVLCRLMNDSLPDVKREIEYQLHEVDLTFRTLPYIEEGQEY